MLTVPERAAEIARHIARHSEHGYSQPNRAGVGTGGGATEKVTLSDGTNVRIAPGDRDCSSLAIECYAAQDVDCGGAWYTGDMKKDMVASGNFRTLKASTWRDPQPGDILLASGKHAAVAVGGGKLVEAISSEKGTTHGKLGDQTGREIWVRDLYDDGWDCVLRYCGPDAAAGGGWLDGIDISGHQVGIDLSAVPLDFVVIKATQGSDYKSDQYADQMLQAARLGKLYGVYHYIDGSGAKAEADHFLKVVKARIGKAVLAVDWEKTQNGAWGDYDYLDAVVSRIVDKTGIPPLIYCQQSVMAKVRKVADRHGCALWVAQYGDMDKTGYQPKPWNEGRYACAMRQYSSNGRLEGWGGALDLNKFYGGADAWKAYATGGKPAPAPEPEIWQIEEDGIWGPETTALAQAVEGIAVTGKVYRQPAGNRALVAVGGQCSAFVWVDEMPDEGSLLIRRIQNDSGTPWSECDGIFGPKTSRAFIKRWVKKPKDTAKLGYQSGAVKNWQKWLNERAREMGITRVDY